MHAELFLARGKCNEANVVEEYYCAITKAVGQSCCGRSGFIVFGFQLDSLVFS